MFAFDLLNGMGDFIDISHFLFEDRRPDINTLNRQRLQSMVLYIHTCIIDIELVI